MSEWHKSSFCDTSACVEVARAENGDVMVRDSASPEQPPLWFSPVEWRDFVAGVKSGEFDL